MADLDDLQARIAFWAESGAIGTGFPFVRRASVRRVESRGRRMLRFIAAAAAALALVAPAVAQPASLLTSGPWECKLRSLIGDPDADMLISYDAEGGLFANFYVEVPVEDEVVAVEFELSGEWTLSDSVITVETGETQVINAWKGDEELPFDVVQELGTSFADALGGEAAESTISFINEHALVLTEAETSISCWR